MVDYSNSGKDFEMPVDIMEKWQRMVNIMSKLLRVPTAFIMKVNASHIQIFTTNVADTNPYHAGQNFELDGLYCEEVMKSDNLLLVPDASKDPEWDNNPEIPAGFVYYLGIPIHWPTGKMFGTICVQDYKNNPHATDNKGLLEEFKSVCEIDLLMVQTRMNMEGIVAERTLNLRMSEERYRFLVEASPSAIMAIRDRQIIYANLAGARLLGFDEPQEIIGLDIMEVVAPGSRELVAERIKHLEEGKSNPQNEIELLRSDGVIAIAESTSIAINFPDGPASLIIAQDITERKETENKIKMHGEFQEIVSRISNKFIDLSGDEFEEGIQDAFTQIGLYFDVDSVRLYRLSPKGEVLKLRINWRAEGLAPPGEMPELLKKNYQGFAAHYSQGESIFFDSSHECPPWPGMRETMEFLGVKAGLGVPLEIDDSGVDIFAMDKLDEDYTWPEDILRHAETIGKILLGAMRRREAEVELQDSYDEIKRLKNRLEQENIYLREEIRERYNHGEIVGDSQAIKSVLGQVDKVANQETSVLILGETGTGKELIAQAIHDSSHCKERVMIKVNCAALPATLVESELFGREKGAFTGALSKRIGRFEAADGSTLFLDEIGDLPLEIQVKLLRVLHDGQFERLGSTDSITVNVRIIAATNRDLEQAIRENKFRKDLYYRLSVFPITIPPLRERREDIPQLTWTVIKEFGNKMGKPIEKIQKKTMDMLQSYQWPGNVRELKNVIERAMILNTSTTLNIDRIKTDNLETPRHITLEGVERDHILQVLESTGWKVSGKNGAAEILGLKESTLRARMGKLEIKREK